MTPILSLPLSSRGDALVVDDAPTEETAAERHLRPVTAPEAGRAGASGERPAARTTPHRGLGSFLTPRLGAI